MFDKLVFFFRDRDALRRQRKSLLLDQAKAGSVKALGQLAKLCKDSGDFASAIKYWLFEGAKVAVDCGPAELVVEGGGAERALEHDVEGGDDAGRFAEIFFPGPDGSGDFQI